MDRRVPAEWGELGTLTFIIDILREHICGLFAVG